MNKEITVKFKDGTKFKRYMDSYEFIGDKMIKINMHFGRSYYTDFYSIDNICEMTIEEKANEIED